MDVIELRRGLLAQMAKGKSFISGTITAPTTIGNAVIDFGRTSNNYLFVVEADNESKKVIAESGETSAKAFGWFGVYPMPSISGLSFQPFQSTATRIIPSTSVISTSNTTAPTLGDTSIAFPARSITSANANHFYFGLKYNYTIVFLD